MATGNNIIRDIGASITIPTDNANPNILRTSKGLNANTMKIVVMISAADVTTPAVFPSPIPTAEEISYPFSYSSLIRVMINIE